MSGYKTKVILLTGTCIQYTVEKVKKEMVDGIWYMNWNYSRTLVDMVDFPAWLVRSDTAQCILGVHLYHCLLSPA